MAIPRIKVWNAGDTLTAADLNGEFNNIIDNALSLISPLTGNLDCGGFGLFGIGGGAEATPDLRWSLDTDTGIRRLGANRLGFVTGGADRWEVDASGHLVPVDDNVYDIGTATAGVRNIYSGGQTVLIEEDARTNTVDVPFVLRSTTTGVPTNGIGIGLDFQAKSAGENPSDVGRVQFDLWDAGAGTEASRMDILLRVAGAALASAYRFQVTTGFRGIFTHANTADRTYTLPDASDTLVGQATSDTLTNKTLTTPTIGDFTNAQHDHSTAAGGGSISSVELQEFASSGTYTKPSGAVGVLVMAWGGGGGGRSESGGGGGGGGAFAWRIFDAADVGATETVTVGSGGGVNASGGNTTFGTLLTAYGGANSGGPALGGGGGGASGAGSGQTSGGPSGGGSGTNNDGWGGGGGGDSGIVGGDSGYGGGGGGGNNANGGQSYYGGGGGAGDTASGGSSTWGGNGGNANVAGAVPGGGGGRNAAGGGGRVEVFTWS